MDGYKTAQNDYPNKFNLIERISAGYIMNTVDIGKLRIMAGLRLEHTLMNTFGYDVTLYPAGSKNCPTSTGCGTPVPVTTNRSYIDPLPSATLRYALTPDSDIRAVYGRGISRPDPYQLIPYVTEDDSTNPAQHSIGNPDLRPTHANNYDLLYERFLRPIGMIQAGVFYKQLSSPLVSTLYTPITGEWAGPPVTRKSMEPTRTSRDSRFLPATLHVSSRPSEGARSDGQLQLHRLPRKEPAGQAGQPGLAMAGAAYLEHQSDLRS